MNLRFEPFVLCALGSVKHQDLVTFDTTIVVNGAVIQGELISELTYMNGVLKAISQTDPSDLAREWSNGNISLADQLEAALSDYQADMAGAYEDWARTPQGHPRAGDPLYTYVHLQNATSNGGVSIGYLRIPVEAIEAMTVGAFHRRMDPPLNVP